MKKILIILLFVLFVLTVNAQVDSVKYKCYKPCPDCTEKWKTGKSNSPLDYNTRVNQSALETKKRGNNFVRTLGGIVATVFIGTFTAIVISKSNNLANNATY